MSLYFPAGLALTLAFFSAAPSARAAVQSTPPAQAATDGQVPAPEIVRAIAALEARLDEALAGRDRAALEPIIAAPFTWVHASDGRVDTREVWLAAAAQGMALSGQRNARSEHGVTLMAHGQPQPHTVVRVARVRLRDEGKRRESWLRQTQVFVRGSNGSWQLASGQGTLMYEGQPVDPALYARYAGTYVIAPGRTLTLRWGGDALLATFPNGATTQIFLASPTDEAVRMQSAGRLRFTLGSDGRPLTAALVRDDAEVWRATRSMP